MYCLSRGDTINDIFDKNLDLHIKRIKNRSLANKSSINGLI
ncbi:hypothetical protein NLO413_0923 [Candidatus Neoehrlichia lotoris str. RAC413]|uniref:Uncharacterized protein n=1 Tax=Candidatus Neoehrlichia procyonis str. RAC413 TaxID=1359163 RepID=A0A0F3NN92_9RICK|nr:hypothetical protein NLO413_0923 [Candidatus Neoehrlichia lotoris str. RAC413]